MEISWELNILKNEFKKNIYMIGKEYRAQSLKH